MCIWTNLEITLSHEGIHYNQSDQVVLLLIGYKISYNNEKLFLHSLCHLCERISLVTCKQRQAILLQWCDLTSSGDGSTFSGYGYTIRTASTTIRIMWHKIAFHLKLTIDSCTQYERWKPEIHGLHRCLPEERCEAIIFLLLLAPMCFLWNNLWSVCRYRMGPFSGWWSLGGNDQQNLVAPVWKYRSRCM